VFAGFTAISAGWYFIRGRKSFVGPKGAVETEEFDGDVPTVPEKSVYEKVEE